MTVPARDQHGGAQGWLGHESGYLRVKFTYPLGKKFPVSGINRACKSILCPGLWVYLEEHPMEVWVSGSKLYAVVLADTELQKIMADLSADALAEVDTVIQAVGKGKMAKAKKC